MKKLNMKMAQLCVNNLYSPTELASSDRVNHEDGLYISYVIASCDWRYRIMKNIKHGRDLDPKGKIYEF